MSNQIEADAIRAELMKQLKKKCPFIVWHVDIIDYGMHQLMLSTDAFYFKVYAQTVFKTLVCHIDISIYHGKTSERYNKKEISSRASKLIKQLKEMIKNEKL